MPTARTVPSHSHVFAPGEVVFREGERGFTAYVIQRGRINLTCQQAAEQLHIATLGPGEIIGEVTLLEDAERSATATAAEETELLVVDRDLLRQRLGAADPMLRLLMRALLDRIRRQRRSLGEGAGPSPGPVPEQAVARDKNHVERRAIEAVRFEQELRRGLAGGEFELLLQPIVYLTSGRTVGFEALMAWQHPSRGPLSPASFIAMAERSGLVRQLDDLALRLAARALKRLSSAGKARRSMLQVSVNLSGVRAQDTDTVDRVRRLLEEEELAPTAVTLEITESWLVDNPGHAQGVLSRLKDLGLRLALDDFGTGYSSLAYLHRFPIDYLKVDRSFIQGMMTSDGSTKIVRAVVALAHTLGLKTIAEGIDDPTQIGILREMSCEFGQGYHFSRPLKIGQALAYLERETD